MASTSATEDHLLDCEALEYRIGGLRITDGVSFNVQAGEVCGVVGPNGSGKTTLLNLISGFSRPQSGAVRVLGQDVVSFPPNRRARLGVARTFQHVRGVEECTAIENALLGLYSNRGRRIQTLRTKRADGLLAEEALRRTAVQEYAQWPIRYLSYGTRKKVELARAVISQPRLLLVDEPTSGVSLAHVAAFESVIIEEAARGCAVIVVDHDLEFVSKVASRVIVLDVGRVIFEGTPVEAFSSPRVIEAYIGAAQEGEGVAAA